VIVAEAASGMTVLDSTIFRSCGRGRRPEDSEPVGITDAYKELTSVQRRRKYEVFN